jgi:hypothetical protein
VGKPEVVLVAAVLILGLLFIPWLIGKVAFGRLKPVQELDELLAQAVLLRSLSAELQQALDDVDGIAKRLQTVSADALARYDDFEARVSALSHRQKALADEVRVLSRVPLPAVEAFTSLLRDEGRSNARRDYVLFLAGMLYSFVVSFVFFQLGS